MLTNLPQEFYSSMAPEIYNLVTFTLSEESYSFLE